MKKTTVFGIVIFVLLTCNVFLLYTNIDRQNEINALATVQNVEPETTMLSAGEILDQNTKIVHPEVALPKTGVSLVVFFTIRSCSSCLEYEVPNLNSFYNQFPENTEAYLITGGKPFLEKYGATFDAKIISPADSVFNASIPVDNSVAAVVDSSGTVQSIYLSEVGNKPKSDRFYERMNTFFNSLH